MLQSLNDFSCGSVLEASDWLDEVKMAIDVGEWSWSFTRAAVCTKLVGPARHWQRDYGQVASSFMEWEIAFREAYMPEERMKDLLDDFLLSHQKRKESVKRTFAGSNRW